VGIDHLLLARILQPWQRDGSTYHLDQYRSHYYLVLCVRAGSQGRREGHHYMVAVLSEVWRKEEEKKDS